MKTKLLFTILKYGSVVAVIGFILFSIYSSYTLREEIGSLKNEISTLETSQSNMLNILKQNKETLERVSEQRRIIILDIRHLEKVDDKEFLEELFNRLYTNP